MAPPSLVALCLRVLARYPDQIHALPVRLRLRPHLAAALLDDLFPDPAVLEPRLWAVLTQLYAPLPAYLAACPVPLYDSRLPLLQAIPPSDLFSLVTLLDLSATQHLTDQTIHQLKFLHLLTALDASGNPISSYAIKSLAATMQPNHDEDDPRPHHGPFELRALALRNCKNINNDVYPELDRFPLLSIVDLRGTSCTPIASTHFKPCDNDELYYPASLRVSLAALQALQPHLSASAKPYIITIDKLHHPETQSTARPGRFGQQDSFVVIPSNPANKVIVGNTNVYERQVEAREECLKHEQNKEAWYARQDTLAMRDYDRYILQQERKKLSRPPIDFQNRGHKDASTRLSKPRSIPLGNRALTPRPQAIGPQSLLTSGPKLHTDRPTTVVSSLPAGIKPVSARLSRHHPPPNQNQSQRAPSAPSRSHHSSTALNQASVQRPLATAISALVHAGSSSLHHSMPRNEGAADQSLAGMCSRTAFTTIGPRVTNDIGHPAAPVSAGGQPGADAASFYTRVSSAPSSHKAVSSGTHASAARALRDVPHAHLRLLRPPPAYAVLGEELARQGKAKRQREAEREDGIVRKGTTSLSGTAAVNMDSAKAQKMREAMDNAFKERAKGAKGIMKPPDFQFDFERAGRKRTASSISMSAPTFPFPDSVSPTTSGAGSSKMRAMSALAALSASPFAVGPSEASSSASRSRNPFRKRIVSLPDIPALGASDKTKDKLTSIFIETPVKEGKFPAKTATPVNTIVAIRRELSMDKLPPSKPNASMIDKCPPIDVVVNPKPLIPISSVKVPILPEEARREMLRREAGGESIPRKRANDDGDNEQDDDVDDNSKQRSLKRRIITKGRTSTSSISSSKGKGREKEKPKAFDWKGWAKKDGT